MMQRLIIGTIRLYQHTISPDHGVYAGYTTYGCRYTPSCSEYMIRSIQLHGILKGVVRGLWRIVRCNPWSAGGVDEPTKL